ncbi:MAG: TlpA disulfide reductase family protein [Melioribacteraceae bacterium]|nr:TlpA disulfide reductase family protein [Melioribacteraceae bacterium]
MKTKLFIILVLFLISSALIAQDDVASSTLLNLGDKLPSFNVPSLGGGTYSSNELKGKVILINFWATWCPPCRAEFPLLQKDIYDTIKESNFRVMAISRGEEIDTVKNFIDKYKYTFPVYLDKEAKVYNLFANKYIPRNFVIGKDGIVKWASTGFKKDEFYEMVNLIKKELKK